ncbi:hypothetical protein PHYPSEUDO_009988 [Phytophthora pseudosyringae]|uniref:ZSWIM3 N-terminal domain-containing protein n=1 Tax=Phytophthora pseudosyringae TaxID=221518 RepID=A0A8T1W8I0_9STRA|nr:hypothetical protein PHYPSEUDO_009988 [Phytophthora pseudosyringae]
MTTIFLKKTMSPKRTNPALKCNENEQRERPTSRECSWPKMTITKLLLENCFWNEGCFKVMVALATNLFACLFLAEIRSTTKKRRYSPHVTVLKRQNVAHERGNSDDITACEGRGSVSNNDQRDVTKAVDGDDEILELDSFDGDQDNIIHVVPPYPAGDIETWEEFDKMFKEYKKKNKLKFRVRSSQSTELHNSTHEEQLPPRFQWSHKIFRCTHGVNQGSRSKGYRNRKSRYCGCKARLTATVVQTDNYKYAIVIRNENHTHSLPTTDSVASSYLTTKTLPLDDQDWEDVKTLADARVSSKHIANYLNERIGCKVTPQQTRNLIRSIMGHDSAGDRLKDMLHALRQVMAAMCL